jgi:iron uptake system EfeUOB component EfeO/EfeM
MKSNIKYDESEGPTKEDNGELDQVVVYRENDIANGAKFSGWTNPLSWTDSGADDDTVVLQIKSNIKYDESEGPTKEDNGELDQVVVYRESDVANGAKFSGWTNPLSWTDNGADDDTVV